MKTVAMRALLLILRGPGAALSPLRRMFSVPDTIDSRTASQVREI